MRTRRDFIKISASGLGAVALGLGTEGVAGKAAQWINRKTGGAGVPAGRRFPTYCEVCFWKCAGWTYVNGQGQIEKIVGNDHDPHSNGRLCTRGTGGIGMYYDPDRLKKPLIRVRRNGRQDFAEATWDEALTRVAENLRRIAGAYGPESIALFNHGSAGEHFSYLLRAMGSENIAAPSYAQCRGPREAGFIATFGSSVGSPEQTDIRDTRCMVLIGSHLGENMHNTQVQEMSDAIDKGAAIITVDPRYSVAASKSKYWLPIKPATDMALLLAWIHVLIFENIYNKAYVDQYTYGLDLLKEHVRNTTPEWAYGITTIKPDIIRKTAREMASVAPAVLIHPGRHVTWYGDDTQRSRAIAILNALLGSWGHRGGFFFREAVDLPGFPHPPFPEPAWSWKELQAQKYPLADSAITNVLMEATLADENDKRKIRGWLVAGTNLPLTMPDKKMLENAFQALDFMVVIDTMPMEITGYADVVLPECTYLERYDELRNSAFREPNLALRMPATEPLYDSKPAWWITKKLGEKLGLGKYFPWDDYSVVIDWQLKQVGSSLEEIKKTGIIKFPRETGDLYLTPGEPYEFNTNTGKIELYSTEFAAAGYDPMPVYKAHPEPPPGYYRLIYGRAPAHTFSRTANNPALTDLMDENDLWINPKVAELWGLVTGQYIYLRNQDGVKSTFPIRVRVTERIRWDSVYMVHGFGHSWPKLHQAFGKGASDTEMITAVLTDPVMGGSGMRSNFVTFVTGKPARKEAEL